MISIDNYNENRGIYSPIVEHNGCICGYWLTGNNYRGNDNKVAAYWEPGAPSPSDRLMAIAHASTLEYRTSVSMEPLLIEQPKEMIDQLFMGWITGEIWIGAMNHYHLHPEIPDEARQIKIQGRENMQRVYDSLKDNPQIRWKDSVQRLLGITATGQLADSMKAGVREP